MSDIQRTEAALAKVVAWAEAHPDLSWKEGVKNALDTLTEEMATLERELAAANAELGALKREVLALGTGLIRVRQQIFPAHDQTAVIRRDFPIYATIAAKEKPN